METILRPIKNLFLRKSLVRTILLSYMSINIMLLIIFGIVAMRDSTSDLKAETIYYTSELTNQGVFRLNEHIEEIQRNLWIVSSDFTVIQSLMHYNNADIGRQLRLDREVNDVLSQISARNPLIKDIFIIGDNYVNNMVNRRNMNWEYSFFEQDWYQRAVENNSREIVNLGLHLQDYYLPRYLESDTLTYSMSIPVFDYNQNKIGDVVATINLSNLSNLLNLNPHRRGEVFLIDEQGSIISSSENNTSTQTFAEFSSLSKHFANEARGYYTQKLENNDFLLVYSPTSIQDSIFVSMVSMEDITKSANSLRNKLSNIIFWSVLLNVVVSVLITLLIYRPFRKFIDKLDRPSEKALNIDPIDYNYTELNHIGTKFDDLIKRINALITENYIKDIAKKEATVKQLQAQINPHVMFNSLQLLQTEIVCGNKEESNKIILSLSSLLRYSMNQTQEIVPLEKEINHIKQYLYIMNQKYRNKIRLDNMISLKVQQNYKVVKLTIQPIIENCIKHGFDPQQSDKTIKIEACIAEDVLSIVISNNGLNIPEKKVIEMNKAFSKASSKAESIGLYNVNQRIQLICGSKYGLTIENEGNKWTKVRLCFPVNLIE